jgi:hypothetical protein
MNRAAPSHRMLTALLALVAALPSLAQAQAAPPPPEQLPWAQPAPQAAEPQQGLLPRKEAPAQPAPQPAYAPAPQQSPPQQVYAPAQPQPQYAAPPQQQYAAPPQQQYAAPPQQQYAAPPQQQYAAPPQQQYAAPPQQQYAAPQQQAPVYPPPQPYPAQQQAYPAPPTQAYPPQQAYPPATGYPAPMQAYPLASPPPGQARPPQPSYRPDYAYDPRTGTWFLLAPPPPQAYAVPVQPPPAAPAPAAAPPAPLIPQPRPFEPEVEFAIRAGVASPGGDALPGVAMDQLFGKEFALGLELGVRATPHLHVGLFAEGAGGMAGSDFAGMSGCTGSSSCDGSSVSGRVGLQLRYHLLPYHAVDPWIAYGVALSGAAVESPTTNGTLRRTLSGYEYAKLSAGLDFKLGRGSALGLFAEWTAGRFTEYEDKLNGGLVSSGAISPTATHSWFTVGPRIRF